MRWGRIGQSMDETTLRKINIARRILDGVALLLVFLYFPLSFFLSGFGGGYTDENGNFVEPGTLTDFWNNENYGDSLRFFVVLSYFLMLIALLTIVIRLVGKGKFARRGEVVLESIGFFTILLALASLTAFHSLPLNVISAVFLIISLCCLAVEAYLGYKVAKRAHRQVKK